MEIACPQVWKVWKKRTSKKTKPMDIDCDIEHLRWYWFCKGEGEWQMGNLPFGWRVSFENYLKCKSNEARKNAVRNKGICPRETLKNPKMCRPATRVQNRSTKFRKKLQSNKIIFYRKKKHFCLLQPYLALAHISTKPEKGSCRDCRERAV